MNAKPPSLGFGLERVGTLTLANRRGAWALVVVAFALVVLGLTRLSFDQELRKVFRGETEAYRVYTKATADFADPENETLVLVEGKGLGTPENFSRLQDLHFELQLIDGVDSVFSLFSLRRRPDAQGNMPTLVADPYDGLTGELAESIRGHPLLGAKLLSADADAMLFVVTPATAAAPLSVHRALHRRIAEIAGEVLGGGGLRVTVSGFPAIRTGIVDLLQRDQKVLNAAGAAIGLVLSLVIFGSLSIAVLTAAPAILAGVTVLGAMGLAGLQLTVLSNVIPALIMILGYADAMHLNSALRHHRDSGLSLEQAERRALVEIGPACMLTALTTAMAFLSLTISDVAIVRDFGWTGVFATVLGTATVLVLHALLAPLLAGSWTGRDKARAALLDRLAAPSGMIGRFACKHARAVSVTAVVMFFAFGAMHLSVPPEHSIREHLATDNPANAALGRIDRAFGGAFPVTIVVPLGGEPATGPLALQRIAAVHRAVGAVVGAGAPFPCGAWRNGSARMTKRNCSGASTSSSASFPPLSAAALSAIPAMHW